MEKTNFDSKRIQLAATTLRMLAADGVQKANSGHPGMPMGMADCAAVLWTQFLKFNPQVPDWHNRDRFVLSAGHGSMLLYSLLYLSGYQVTLDDLQSFRQWNSRTPGHPEAGCLPGVETTTGPLGQGFANGVGMAIAAKMTEAKYNRDDYAPFGKHFIYAIVSDGDLMEGVASEAASLAGHLALGNIIYLYDKNSITIEGETRLTFTENVAGRFDAYGWHTINIDGHDHAQIAAAIEAGQKETGRPTLILAKTHIGFGSPHKQDTAGVHGSPLGEEELAATKRNLGWPEEPQFYVPAEVKELFQERVKNLKSEYKHWQQEFDSWEKNYPKLAAEYQSAKERKIPVSLEEELLAALPDEAAATRSLSGRVMQKIAELLPCFVGGSADLAPSTSTFLKQYESISAGNFSGRNFHFGIREHGMGGILNGIALYGGFVPFGATFLVFSDYMRPAIRLAALMELPVVYVFTHDSIFLGEDGPTHQPVEHAAALRAIPNLTVIRPADGMEVALGWAAALRNTHGPTALLLTRQKVARLERKADFDPRLVLKGGYIFSAENTGSPAVVLIATGSELEVAVEAQKILQVKGYPARVVSMPSLEIFQSQPEAYKNSVIPVRDSRVVVVEAGVSQGWGNLTRLPFLMIGLERFGASAPQQVLAEKFGFTGKQVAQRVMDWLKK